MSLTRFLDLYNAPAGVTVSPTGVGGAGNVGSVTVTITTVALTGVAGTGAVGDVTVTAEQLTPPSFGNAVQQTVYTILNGNISAGVYDDVPFLPEGKPREDFPYVVIGEDTSRPWDTDDTVGQAVSIDLHVWSRTAGMKETKTIMGEIFDLLHRASPTISHYNVVDCLCIRQLTTVNPDGRTDSAL